MALHFDLVDLRLLVRVAEANSLTRGAEASHLSLPAASARIRNLEDSSGTRLFHRSSQGVTLTPAGQAFVHHAQLVLGQLEHLQADLQEYARGIKGHLRIQANTTAMGEFLPPVLSHYLHHHPDVNIDLRERMSGDIIRAVIDGHTDIGIVAGSVRTENLQSLPYRQDHLVLVVPPGHALDCAEPVSFASTLDYDHVALHEASAIHAFLRQAADRLQRALPVRIQVGSFEAACRMVEAGVGVGVMPASAARRLAANMDLRIVALADSWSLRAMQICVRDLDKLPAFARALVDLLVEDAAAAAPGAVGLGA